MTTATVDSNWTAGSIAGRNPRLLLPVLLSGLMAQGLAFTAFVSALPQMAHALGSRGGVVAPMTMALTALGLMLGALVSGWVLERVGTRSTLVAGLLIYAILGGAGLVSHDPTVLLVTRFVTGFAAACMVTTCIWGIAAEYTGDRRAKILGTASSLANVAALAGTLIGGLLAQLGGWQLPFVQFLVFGLAALPFALLGIKQVRPQPNSADGTRRPFLKRLLPFYLLAALLFAILFMASTQYAFLLEESGIRNPTVRSLILGTVTAVGALMALFYGSIQRVLQVEGAFLLGVAAMILALTLNGLGGASHPALAFLSAALMGVYAGLVLPYLYHSITVNADAHVRSRAIGLLTAFGFLGGFLNPPIFLTLSKHFGLPNAFLVSAAVLVVVGAGAALKISRDRRVQGQQLPLH